jgi:hypothetical protein
VYRIKSPQRAVLIRADGGGTLPMKRDKPERVGTFAVVERSIDRVRSAVRERLTAQGFKVRNINFASARGQIVAYVEE